MSRSWSRNATNFLKIILPSCDITNFQNLKFKIIPKHITRKQTEFHFFHSLIPSFSRSLFAHFLILFLSFPHSFGLILPLDSFILGNNWNHSKAENLNKNEYEHIWAFLLHIQHQSRKLIRQEEKIKIVLPQYEHRLICLALTSFNKIAEHKTLLITSVLNAP